MAFFDHDHALNRNITSELSLSFFKKYCVKSIVKICGFDCIAPYDIVKISVSLKSIFPEAKHNLNMIKVKLHR